MTRRTLAGFALALTLVCAPGATPPASAQEQKCTTPVANPANPGCGDANRGMILYGQVPTASVPYTWACNQCHSANPLTDTLSSPAPAPSLIRAAPRDPGYIQYMMYKQPDAAPIIAAMDSCCNADRPPDNVMGDLGDLAEFLYTCKMGIAPCVVGGGGGGGGPTQGQLEGSGTMKFADQAVGSTSAPLTLKLTNIGAPTVNVSAVASDSAEFVIASNNCTSLSQTAYCTVQVAFQPSATGPRSGVITVTSDGLFSPQRFTFTGNGVAGAAVNYGGIWWNAPASSESGWGINFQHDGNVIFATWFTYDAAGKPWWLVMTAPQGAGNTFTGTLYKTTGSGYDAASFTAGTPVEAGTGTLTFTDANTATFSYNVTGFAPKVKTLTRQVFGPLPSCTYGPAPNFNAATNYQGLWWNAAESGWGINFAHQGATIFASWFTFDTDGSPLWLVATMDKGTGESFSGKLFRMTATPFGVTPFVANTPVEVGTATLAFANGNSASFSYTIGAVSKTRSITRQPLGAPTAGTICN